MSSSCFDEVDMLLMPEPDAESLHEEDREEDVDDANLLNVMSTDDIAVPLNVKDALSSLYANEWRASMQKEMNSLQPNKTWTLVDLPKGKKAVRAKKTS
ncbi:hypothetical protein ACLKA6_000180 [Drosophila palustris]